MRLKNLTVFALVLTLFSQACLPAGKLLVCFETDGNPHVEMSTSLPDGCETEDCESNICENDCNDSVLRILDPSRTDDRFTLAKVSVLNSPVTRGLSKPPIDTGLLSEELKAHAPTITQLATVILLI